MRLASQQTALGPDYNVVGVEAYNPKTADLTKRQRQKVAMGDFSPLTIPLFRVVEALGLNNNQDVAMYGQSLGGDLAMQFGHDVMFNPQRGVAPLSAIGAIEMARNIDRGRLGIIKAMTSSGGELAQNVVDSQSDALLEAWGVKLPAKSEKAMMKKINGKVNSDVGKYVFASLREAAAMTGGFGTDKSSSQAEALLRRTTLPMFIARSLRSTVFDAATFANLRNEYESRQNTIFYEENGDHSSDDNIRRSAARILYFASNLVV
jgi:alpha-beta hydrolase superfamily lysophospholipase